MEKLNKIKISRKVHTPLKFDLSNFNFPEGSKLIWTVKSSPNGEEIITREFTEQRVFNELITPSEIKNMKLNDYYYDFVLVLADGTKLKQCLISDIEIEDTIYGTNNSN